MYSGRRFLLEPNPLKARAERYVNFRLRAFLYLNAFKPPGVIGQDLVSGHVANYEAVRRHQLQCRFKLGDTTDRDQVGSARAILPQSRIQNSARRT
jgi:hypothetical protein